ncbi:MAG: prepilin peptidase [Firmicutes bacterium]|nr:prepilin peptidase [Bacillota bacterium]
MKKRLIPNAAICAAAALWIAAAVLLPLSLRELAAGILTAATAGAVFLLIAVLTALRGAGRALGSALGTALGTALGGGDVKLIAVSGLYLHPIALLLAVFMAALLGLVWMLGKKLMIHRVLRDQNASLDASGGSEEIPFGPFLAVSVTAMLFFGDYITNWFLQL